MILKLLFLMIFMLAAVPAGALGRMQPKQRKPVDHSKEKPDLQIINVQYLEGAASPGANENPGAKASVDIRNNRMDRTLTGILFNVDIFDQAHKKRIETQAIYVRIDFYNSSGRLTVIPGDTVTVPFPVQRKVLTPSGYLVEFRATNYSYRPYNKDTDKTSVGRLMAPEKWPFGETSGPVLDKQK